MTDEGRRVHVVGCVSQSRNGWFKQENTEGKWGDTQSQSARGVSMTFCRCCSLRNRYNSQLNGTTMRKSCMSGHGQNR